MASALFPFHALRAPLHAFAGWLLATPAPRSTRPLQRPAAPDLRAASVARPARPVRVVRVFDGPRAGSGRMVIAGRMSDVCAELDRLAALEAAGR